MFSRSSRRIVDALASLTVGAVATRMSILARDLAPDATVLRQALLGNVEPGHDLHAEMIEGMNCGPPAASPYSTPSMR